MKDIYSLLNEVDTDLDSYIREELEEREKVIMIDNIRQMSGNKYKSKKRRYTTIAACAMIAVLLVSTISFNDTAYASVKSIVWQISDFLGVEKNLDDYTTVIGSEVKDKGYAITLNEVILDKDQLIVSSYIKADEKIDEGGLMEFADVYINGKKASVAGGGGEKYIDEYTVSSVMEYELEDVNTNDNLEIQILYNSILRNAQEIKGKWDFHFKADGQKLAADTTYINLNNKFTLPNGSEVVLKEYTSNDLGEKIYFELDNWNYKKDPMYDLKLVGTDNLGNKVEFELSYMKGQEKIGRFNLSSICEGIGEEVDSITLKPYAVKMPEKSGRMSHDFEEVGDSFTINLINK